MENQNTIGNRKPLLDVGAVAQLARTSKRTVLHLLKDKKLKGMKVNNRWFITQQDFDRTFIGTTETESPLADTDFNRIPKVLLNFEQDLTYLRTAIAGSSNILKGAATTGIVAIYPPRRTSTESNDAIKELIKNANGEILLSAVSLRQFFHDKPFNQDLYDAMKSGVNVRALLLDPLSHSAMARVFVEESIDGQNNEYNSPSQIVSSGLFKDVERSINNIRNLQKVFKDPSRLDVRFYDCSPFAFFILTDRGMIIEQYHFGREDSPIGGCIGELVPLFHLTPTSNFYKVIRNSFNHIWEGRNPFIASKTLNNVIKQVLHVTQHRRQQRSQRRPPQKHRSHTKS